jgi:hypothetical protein
MAALPGMAIAFIFVFEVPMTIKHWIYKAPVWIISTAINILIVTPMASWMIGPLAVFVGEFILFPTMALDKKIVNDRVELLKEANMYPPSRKKSMHVLMKEAKKTVKKSDNEKGFFRKLIGRFSK